MAFPDPHTWYTLHLSTSASQSLSSNSASASTLSLAITNSSAPSQRWQFFPITITLPSTTPSSNTSSSQNEIRTTYYALRSFSSGPTAFLGTHISPSTSSSTEDSHTTTKPWLVIADAVDQSVLWQLGQWDDGSWWMSNVRNGTGWRMGWEGEGVGSGEGGMVMRKDGERARWGFKEAGRVEDGRFETLELFGSVSTTLPSPSTTPSPTPQTIAASPTYSTTLHISNTSISRPTSTATSTTTAFNDVNMSTHTQAALGATIGGIVLLAFLIVVFVIWRKRKGLAGHGRPRQLITDTTSTARPMFELFSEGIKEKGKSGMAEKQIFAKEVVVDVQKSGRDGVKSDWKGKGAQVVEVEEWEKAAELAGVGKRRK